MIWTRTIESEPTADHWPLLLDRSSGMTTLHALDSNQTGV